MFTALLRFFGVPYDLTKSWQKIRMPSLIIDLPARSINGVRFGDPVERAQIFGRPTQFLLPHRNYVELVYENDGFELAFDKGKLSYAAFLVGPDDCFPEKRPSSFSQPLINSTELTQQHSRSRIEALLGRPKLVDCDEEEAILYYEKNSLTIEFELSTQDSLKRVNIYPTNSD